MGIFKPLQYVGKPKNLHTGLTKIRKRIWANLCLFVSTLSCFLGNGNDTDRPNVQVQIIGSKDYANCLFDSGAQLCLISKKAFRGIHISKRRKLRSNLTCSGLTGSKLRILGCYLIEFKIHGKNVFHPFYVTDTSAMTNRKYDAILGVDFARKHGLSYNSITNSTYLEAPEKVLSAAVLRKDTYIPARCSTKVKLKLPHKDLQTLVVDVPGCCQIFPSEYLLEPKTEDGHAVCYLTNTSFSPQKLPKGTILGTCEKLSSDELIPFDRDKQIDVEKQFDVESHTPTSVGAEHLKLPPRPPLTSARKHQIAKFASLDHLSKTDKNILLNVLFKYHKCLSLSEFDLGVCKLGSHSIPTKLGVPPTYSKQFPLGYEAEKEVRRQIEEWIKLGIVTECESSYNSALFCIRKKTPPQKPGCPVPVPSYRVVADCRALNDQTIETNFRLPLISETFDRVSATKPSYYTGLDLRSGFTQLSLDKASQLKTAFTDLKTGIQYCFKRTLQGLRGAPMSFHRVAVRIFKPLLVKGNCQVYLDDILLYNQTFKKHIETLEEALSVIEKSGMLINVEKCEFAVSKITYLGFEMDKDGYRPDKRKMKCITEMKSPTNLSGIRALLGFVNFYRNSVANFSQLVKPLTYLTTKDAKYTGGPLPEPAMKVFRKLQEIFTSRPFLSFPDFSLEFHLYCDASLGNIEDSKANTGGVAGVLVQYPENNKNFPPRPIGFCSRSLKSHELAYTVSMCETLAIIFSIEHFSRFLRAKKFKVYSDHKSLSCVKTVHKRTISRFLEILSNYDFEIIYEKGADMIADFPSRHTGDVAAVTITSKEIKTELTQLQKKIVNPDEEKDVSSTRAKVKFQHNKHVVKNLESSTEVKTNLSHEDMHLQKVTAKINGSGNLDNKNTYSDVCEFEHTRPTALIQQNDPVAANSAILHCKEAEPLNVQFQERSVSCPTYDVHAIEKEEESANAQIEGSPNFQTSVQNCTPEKNEKLHNDRNAVHLEALAAKTIGEFNLNLQYSPTLNVQLLKAQQLDDPFLAQLRIFVQDKILPKRRYRNIIKRYGPNAFLDTRGLLMIRLNREGYINRDLLCLPACRQNEFIAKCHNGQIGGHLKVDKTANRLLEHVWWCGIWSDVSYFIENCSICKRMKAKEKSSNTYLRPLPQCTFPFQKVSLDLKGSYKDELGSKSYILVCVDHFTKYAVFRKIPNKKPETVAKCFYEHFICNFSCPLVVLTDQGVEFVGKLFKELCTLMQIDKIQTAAYRPQTNSTAEVVNRHIGKYLQALILEKGGSWEHYLPSAQHCYNMSIHKALKSSPYACLFGLTHPNSPINASGFNETPLYAENVQHDLARRLQFARKLAIKNNMEFRKDYKAKFDAKVKPHEFSRGHLVYLHRPELVKLKGVQSPWFGPYLIMEMFPNDALIQDLGSKRVRFVNLNRLRMYDISPEEWKKFKLTPVDENRMSQVDNNDKAKPEKEEAERPTYAHFDLDSDIVCLNPEAARDHQPIKVEPELSQDTTSPETLESPRSPEARPNHEGNFFSSLQKSVSKTFGLGSPTDLQKSPLASTSQTNVLSGGNGSSAGSAGTLRMASLPTEEKGRITRRTSKRSDLSMPDVFGNEFWGSDPKHKKSPQK